MGFEYLITKLPQGEDWVKPSTLPLHVGRPQKNLLFQILKAFFGEKKKIYNIV
jgi:hypothetical protein